MLPSPEFTVRAAAGSHDANMSALVLDQIIKGETSILESDALHRATLDKLGPAAIYPDLFSTEPKPLPLQALHMVAAVLLSPWRVTPADPMAAKYETSLKLFKSDLSVVPTKDANIITLTFDNKDGPTAANTLNGLLALYAERRAQLFTDPQLEAVRRQVATTRAAVAAADTALADFKRRHNISDYDQERGLLLHRQSEAEQALADASVAAHEAQARLETLGQRLKTEPASVGLYREKDADTRLLAINSNIADLRAKLAAAREKYRDSSRMVTNLRAQLAASVAESRRLRTDGTESVVREGRNPTIDPLRLDQARAQADAAAAQARLAQLSQEIQRIKAQLAALDQDETELAARIRQKTSAEADFANASRILADRSLSEAEDSRRLANIRLVQPATIPQRPRPTALLIIAAGFVLGVLGAFIWIISAFMLRPVFMTREGLGAATSLPVLAVFNRPFESKREDLFL